MPYNHTAIPPREDPTGQTLLPLTRVKKIIQLDPDVNICSSNAAFVMTLATEMFIQYIAEEAHSITKLERKPRRNIQYRDLAQAVSTRENLEFLEDVIPKTQTYKEIKTSAAKARSRVPGQRTAGDVVDDGYTGPRRSAADRKDKPAAHGGPQNHQHQQQHQHQHQQQHQFQQQLFFTNGGGGGGRKSGGARPSLGNSSSSGAGAGAENGVPDAAATAATATMAGDDPDAQLRMEMDMAAAGAGGGRGGDVEMSG